MPINVSSKITASPRPKTTSNIKWEATHLNPAEHPNVGSWLQADIQLPSDLRLLCPRERTFGTRANLVILLNLSEYGIRQKEIVNSIPAATAAAKDSFDSVWVLWKKQAYLVWKGGEAHDLGRRLDQIEEEMRRQEAHA